MPVQSMQCPKCGKWATEYDLNKWQCLSCQTKFIYEPPPPSEDVNIHHKINTSEFVYTCARCGLNISRLIKPEQSCQECGEDICPDCYTITTEEI